MEKELLQQFIDSLRTTDERQKWYFCRKLRKDCKCGRVDCGTIICGCSW